MTTTYIKTLLVNTAGQELINRLKPQQIAILDESIESIIEGTSTINGKKPENDNEILLCLIHHFYSAKYRFFRAS